MSHHLSEDPARPDVQTIEARLRASGEEREVHGSGNGPLDAFLHALAVPFNIQGYEERAIGQGSDARAVAFVESRRWRHAGVVLRRRCHVNIVTASLLAVLSAVNRCRRQRQIELKLPAASVRRVA